VRARSRATFGLTTPTPWITKAKTAAALRLLSAAFPGLVEAALDQAELNI